LDTNPDITVAAPEARRYSLSLKGHGMTVDREIDEATAFEVLGIVMAGGGVLASPGTPPIRHNVPRPRQRGGQSLREYLDEVEAKRNPDKILAVAKYLANETGGSFTPDDVKARFQEAAERVPGNYGRDFRWTVRNGWIALVSGSKDEYYVTDAGDKALDAKFDAEIKKKTGVSKGRRGGKRRSKKTTASA